MAPLEPHPLVKAVAKKFMSDAANAAAALKEYAAATDLPELIAFAGFLGPTLEQPAPEKTWRLLYLDLELRTWLLVEDAEILVHEKVKDDTAPSGERDMIWVKADVPVGHGSGSPSVEARFLSGEFTRAGDFEAPPGGGSAPAATGVFCQARTPSCCRIRTRR
jgi:hypothetical protein